MKKWLWILSAYLLVANAARPASDFLDGRGMSGRLAQQLGRLIQKKAVVPLTTLAEQAGKSFQLAVPLAPPPEAEWTPEEIYSACSDSVVLVGRAHKCPRCSRWHSAVATGIPVGRDDLFVTAHHVVTNDGNGQALGIMTRDGRLFPVKAIAAADPENDLVIVQTEPTGLRPLPVAEEVRIGAPVFAIHHTAPNLFAFTQGTVVGKFMIKEKDNAPTPVLAVSTDFAPGSSGGPILDRHGAVAGIISSINPITAACIKGTNSPIQMIWKYGIPSSKLLELTKNKPAEPLRTKSKPSSRTAD